MEKGIYEKTILILKEWKKKKKVKILNILFSDSVKLFNVENFLQMKDEDTWLSI